MKKLFALLLALVMALSLVACGEKKDDTGDKTDDSNPSTGMELTQATDLVIATGGTSGAWYPIGVSIADTLTNVDNNLFVTSEVTNGGVENARLLGTHAANVGFVNSDTAYFATQSEDAFASEPAYELYGLANLYDSVLEIAVLADSGINSIADLAGKRVVVGTPASSASTMGWTVLGTYGLTDKDVKGSELSIAEGVEALKNGDVDCVFIFSAAPTAP